MGKLVVFNSFSLDGYFTDKHGDMSWAHENNDAEFNEFTMENARGGGTLLFGRVTYDLMASFWPTPQAAEMLPVVAERMNTLPKIVFSRTMNQALWKNTKVVKSDIAAHMQKLKKESREGLVIMGSGTIVSQLAETGLIDEYQIVLSPVALGAGRTMFEGIKERLHLKLANSRIFKNGKVFLRYKPA